MKRSWVPVLVCLGLLSASAALRGEPAAPAVPANPVAAPAAGCDQQPGALPALEAAPVCQPAAPAAVPDPLAGALFQTWVCCTAEDKAACRDECAPCSFFPHCFAFECVCDCLC
jgi:hypothetical protein